MGTQCGCYSCREQPPAPPLLAMERGPDGTWQWPSPWDVLPPFEMGTPQAPPPWLMDWRIGAMVNTARPFTFVTGI